MKILLFLLIFLFVQPVFCQKTLDQLKNETKTFQNNKRFEIEYDKFKDSSVVRFSSFSIYSAKPGGGIIYFGLSFPFEGNVLKSTPDRINLFFLSSGAAWRFLKLHNLIFILDDERLDLGEGRHNGRINSAGRSAVSESVTFSLTTDELEEIADSKQTELQLGAFEGKLTAEHKQMIKDFIKLGTIK